MSKTDKTRPVGVKVLDDPNWLEEQHNHAKGPCDLPPRPEGRAALVWPAPNSEQRCFWWHSHDFWMHGHNHCGCPMCTDQDGRRADRRRDRHSAKAAARTERQTAAGARSLSDIDDLDDDTLSTPWAVEREEASDHNGLRDSTLTFALVADFLGLPETSLVVAVDPVPGRWDEFAGVEETTSVRVEVLHNDGSREHLELTTGQREFIAAVDGRHLEGAGRA